MKLRSLLLLLSVCFLKANFPAQAQSNIPFSNEELFYVANKIQVRIDSSLTEWKNQTPILLNKFSQAKYVKGDWGGLADCSAKIWIGWDNDGLLIAAETIDDALAFPMTGHDVWSNDCIQMAFDVYDDNNPNYYQSDDREFVFTIADSQAVVYEYTYT